MILLRTKQPSYFIALPKRSKFYNLTPHITDKMFKESQIFLSQKIHSNQTML